MHTSSVPRMLSEPFAQEFEELFQEHYVLVYRTAYGVTGRVEDAEDVVQTIFLRLLQRERPRDFLKNPRGYLYRAAVNLSLTILESRRRRALTEESEDLADAHLAILAAFTKGMADTAGSPRPLANTSGSVQATPNQAGPAAAKQEFEEASIRACDPDKLPPTPAGARGGGANSFQMTPGRTHVLCMTLATIVRHAYGYGPADLDFINPGGRGRGLQLTNVYGLGVEDGKRVRGGPDWVRSDHYTIEAVADGAADAATMSGPMMRELLERRFQLKAHIEMEQIPAFALTVAKGGLKIKPVDTGACTAPPPITPGVPMILRPVGFADVRRGEKPTCGLSLQRNGPNIVAVGGAAMLGGLGRSLGGNLGQVQVLDKTGNTDRFNFLLEFAIDENVRPLVLPPPQDGDASDVPRGQTIFTALEEQLGLKLEPARAPRDFIVIDRVERPSPN